MFEDDSIDSEIAHRDTADWKDLHQRLRSIAKRRVALEAEEATFLIEAEDTRLYRRLGYTTMVEYMERELYWGPHAGPTNGYASRATCSSCRRSPSCSPTASCASPPCVS
jgi:hypothetical protein